MKFILFFDGQAREPQPAEKKRFMHQWGEWLDFLVSKGILASILSRQENAKKVTGQQVTRCDTGYEDYAGYMINVKNEQEAIEIAKRSPFVSLGGSIIVKPCLELSNI